MLPLQFYCLAVDLQGLGFPVDVSELGIVEFDCTDFFYIGALENSAEGAGLIWTTNKSASISSKGLTTS